METAVRVIIDFATGENWEVPLFLYEKYARDTIEAGNFDCPFQTWTQYWLSMLSEEEGKLVEKA